jgi:1-acyl-sn-glycerol-3-phosphate acyltransferase
VSRRREPVYAATTALGRLVLRGLDVTTRWEGAEHVPATGPVVLAATHVSFPDFVFIGRALLDRRPRVRFMCRHDVWHSRAAAWAMDAMGHVPVDRQAPAAAYLRGRRLLGEGEAVCLFPEGGISTAYTTRALMPGAVALARESGAPLVPVWMWGGQRMWAQKPTQDAPMPRPDLTRGRLVDVRFGEPLRVPPDADLTATTRDLGHRLWRGLESLQRLPEHLPRPGEHAPWYPAHLGGQARDREESYVVDAMPRAAVRPTWGPGAP